MIASLNVVTYNRKAFTKVCIDSIVANTPKGSYELVVVDNHSTDGTNDLLAEYIRNGVIHKTIFNPENFHLGAAINQAYSVSDPDAEWLITFANDEYAMPGWFENFQTVAQDLNPDYLYCMMRVACFGAKPFHRTPNGGHYTELNEGIGATFAIRRKDQRKAGIWFDPTPWHSGYGSPFSVLKHQLDGMGMRGVELAKPCVLIQNCRFNDPSLASYYEETFGIRGKLERWERLKKTANYVDASTLKEYYDGSGYACL